MLSRIMWTRLARVFFIGALLAVGDASPGAQDNPYRLVEGWAQLPAGTEWGQVVSVSRDAQGNIWAFHRTDPPILEFAPSGKLLTSFGSGMFVQAHGLSVDRDGSVWVTDAQGKDGKGHQVFKFSPDGKVLLRLGMAGVAGEGMDTFSGPTDVITAANGDIFVVEGHGNNRIMKFSKDGKFIKTWGKKGSAPGDFDTPHTIALDSRGRVFIGDRANNRIQIFDQDGRFLDQWRQFGRPSGMFIATDDTLYVADDESNETRNPGFNPGIRIGSAKDGTVRAFIPGTSTEDVAGDTSGSVYVAELAGKIVKKYVAK